MPASASRPLTWSSRAGGANGKQKRTASAGDGGSTPAAAGGSLPVNGQFKIVVECEGESQQAELLDRFDQEGLKCRALIG